MSNDIEMLKYENKKYGYTIVADEEKKTCTFYNVDSMDAKEFKELITSVNFFAGDINIYKTIIDGHIILEYIPNDKGKFSPIKCSSQPGRMGRDIITPDPFVFFTNMGCISHFEHQRGARTSLLSIGYLHCYPINKNLGMMIWFYECPRYEIKVYLEYDYPHNPSKLNHVHILKEFYEKVST